MKKFHAGYKTDDQALDYKHNLQTGSTGSVQDEQARFIGKGADVHHTIIEIKSKIRSTSVKLGRVTSQAGCTASFTELIIGYFKPDVRNRLS